MTILEKLEKRKQTADTHLESFKHWTDGLIIYKAICRQISVWSYLRALSQAPATMNPDKIKAHFGLVKALLLEISTDDVEAAKTGYNADLFISNLLNGGITTVNSYSDSLCAWLSQGVPTSFKEEAIELTKNVR